MMNTLLNISKKYISIFSVILLMTGFSFTAHAETTDEEPDNYVSVSIFADKTQVSGGETITLGIENTLYPKWHYYWLNPGDSGTAPTIEWELPEGFSTSAIQWPTPQKIPYDILTNYAYENTTTLIQELNVPDTVSAEPIEITGTINFLVCHDICIPESHDISFTLNGDQNAEADKVKTALEKLPVSVDWKSEFSNNGTDFIITVDTNNQDIISANAVTLFPEEWELIDNNAPATITKTDNGFTVSQTAGERDLSEVREVPVVLAYGIKGDKNAVRLIATPSKTLASAPPVALIPTEATPVIDAPTEPTTGMTKPKMSALQAIIYALLGGIILNLMPCVFPVLSMKALSLMQLQGKEEKKARMYGISYTAGILLSFGLIAGILIALKSILGAQIGWGFQLQNPIVISLLIYLVFIIGLNMIGLFEFSGRMGNVGQKLTEKSGNQGAFFTGVLATLVATPCTAPFMAGAIGVALTLPAAVGIIIFLSLGFGLALPYLALCYIPALRKKLPKPGAWMETFRQFLSFPMFLTAAYLTWVLSNQVAGTGLLYILVGLIGITFLIWYSNLSSKKSGLRKTIIALLVILIALIPFYQKTATTSANSNAEQTQKIGENWTAYSNAKLASVLQTKDPVFVNMTADWCITCKINERIALSPQSTKQIFNDMNIQYLKGDWTNQDAEITQYLTKFGRSGVPLYVYYPAPDTDTETGIRPEPVLLPQILTKGLIKKTLL